MAINILELYLTAGEKYEEALNFRVPQHEKTKSNLKNC